MTSNDFYTTLGKITYLFSSIDFLVSNMAFELGLSKF